jgi:small conductance mechanosensitive channel
MLAIVQEIPSPDPAVADTASAASKSISGWSFVSALDGWVITAVRIAIIFALAQLVIFVASRIVRGLVRKYEDRPNLDPDKQRALTISGLVRSSIRYIVWPIAIITAVSELGVDVRAIIATAGIASLAIGFGAQTLVKDVISGFFLLIDDSMRVGDRVRIGSDYGLVEEMGLRLIRVRKYDGELIMIPAGELRTFGNTSVEFARVVIDIGVAYEQDVEEVMTVVKRVATPWATERQDVLLEAEPEIMGITSFGDSSVNVRVAVKAVPGQQFAADRELRRLLKREFDRVGIEFPFPRQTLYVRKEEDLPPASGFADE